MKNIIWHRRKIDLKEYIERMDINNSDSEKLKKAYKISSEIRKFEIELFWKRAGFFWAFIAAIYTAYFNVLVKIYPAHEVECPPYQHGTIPLLILSGLGLFFCFAWLLSSYGSKHWQENWEKHIDLLEDKITGPLYKIYDAGDSYSESRLTISAGWVVTVCAYGLVIYEFSCFVQKNIGEKGMLPFGVVLIFAILLLFLMFIFSRIVKGNQKSSDIVKFQIKEYEGLND